MIQIKNFNATGKYTLNTVVLTFEIADTSECLSDYQLNVYRSLAIDSDYKLVAENLRTNSYEDSVSLINENVEYYYRIMILDKRTGYIPSKTIDNIENFDTTSSSLLAEYTWSDFTRYASKLADRESFYLAWTYNAYLTRVIKNGTFYLLKKIRGGELCRNNDEIRGACRNPYCEDCYGTGFHRGYYPPVALQLSISSPNSQSETVGRTGMRNEDSPFQAWCAGYPLVDTGDVIISTADRRFRMRVVSAVTSMKNTRVTRHILTLQNITPSDIVYKIPIDVPEMQVSNNGNF